MGLFFATVAMLATAILWVLGFQERQRANPDQRILLFTSPRSGDGWAFAYLMLGGLLLGGAAGFLLSQLPVWLVLLMSWSAVFPYVILVLRHNHQISPRANAPAYS